METTNKIKHSEYDCKGVLKYQIEKLISKIPCPEDFNLYIHKVFPYDEAEKIKKGHACRQNLESIFNEGLRMIYYSSIQETATYYSELSPDKASMIVDADYKGGQQPDEQILVLLALPKTVKINGYDINLSTPEYTHALHGYQRENPEYSQFTQNYDLCDFSYVHNAFVLGAISTHKPDESIQKFLNNGKKFELFENENFFAFQPQEEQDKLMDSIGSRLKSRCNIGALGNKPMIESRIKYWNKKHDEKNHNSGTSRDFWDFD